MYKMISYNKLRQVKHLITGIVCEYNPFHNGHLHQIDCAKQKGADEIVCVMSGNFVQRGECAVIDKWTRAEIAIMCGADVVIELPTPWACASAETFARGSVGLLVNFGIDALSFGCEDADLPLLEKCLEAYNNKEVISLLQSNMVNGMTYPKAMCSAVETVYGEKVSRVITSPNNTLAIEYMKAVSSHKKSVSIIPVLRRGPGHDSAESKENFASASLLRSMNLGKNIRSFVPEKSYEIISASLKNGYAPCNISFCERAVLSSLRELKKEELSAFISDDNGLASRIYEAAKKSTSLNELYDSVKVKNYTHARIRREIMMLFLRCNKNLCNGTVPYMKILAVSKKGLSLLKKAKINSSVPLITKHSDTNFLDERAKAIYDFEASATDKFALCSQKIRACGLEATHSMKIIE